MNPIDYFLDRQIRERAYPWQTTMAACFLLLTKILLILLPTIMGALAAGSFKGSEPIDIPEWHTNVCVTGFNCLGYLSILLFIWTLLNSTQWTCDWIDRVQEKRYFRKWGEHAN